MKTISAKIPDTDHLVIERLAKRAHTGKSAIIREALHEYCTKISSEKTTTADAIDRIFGIFKDNPIDSEKLRKDLSNRIL